MIHRDLIDGCAANWRHARITVVALWSEACFREERYAALRELAKAAPDEVRKYVAEHEMQLSGLSRREALKHL
jgi:hypothetical protein